MAVYAYEKRTNSFPLPLQIAIGVVILGTFIAIVAVSFASPSTTSFFGFSVAYLILAFALVIVTGVILYRWGDF